MGKTVKVTRTNEQLDAQEALIPAVETVPFGVLAAFRASVLFSSLGRPRKRAVDVAIAACAIESGRRALDREIPRLS